MGFKEAFALCLYLLSSPVSAQDSTIFPSSSNIPTLTSAPSPSLAVANSPTRTRLLNEDICEDMGASLIKEINEGIAALGDALAANEERLSQAEVDEVVEKICVLDEAKREVVASIEILCSPLQIARRFVLQTAEEQRSDNGDVVDATTLNVHAAFAAGILVGAQAALAGADSSSIPFFSAAAPVISDLTSPPTETNSLEEANKERDNAGKDDAEDNCILATAEVTIGAARETCSFVEEVKEAVGDVKDTVVELISFYFGRVISALCKKDSTSSSCMSIY